MIVVMKLGRWLNRPTRWSKKQKNFCRRRLFGPKSGLLTKFLATTRRSLLPTFHYNDHDAIVVMKGWQRCGSPTSCGKRAPTTIVVVSRALPSCKNMFRVWVSYGLTRECA